MKHYRDVIVPEHTKQEYTHTTCDACGGVVDQASSTRNFELDWINAERETGVVYPEGGSVERIAFDICFSCFDEICKTIKNNGLVNLDKEEIDV